MEHHIDRVLEAPEAGSICSVREVALEIGITYSRALDLVAYAESEGLVFPIGKSQRTTRGRKGTVWALDTAGVERLAKRQVLL